MLLYQVAAMAAICTHRKQLPGGKAALEGSGQGINTYSFAVMQGASQYALLACCNGLPENSISFWTSVVVLCGSRSPNFYAAQYCMTKVVIAVNVLLRPPMMPEQLVEKHQQSENIAPAQAAACIDSILFSTRVLDLPEFNRV